MSRRLLIAGNWKMNGLKADGVALAEGVAAELRATGLVTFELEDAAALGLWLAHPDDALLEHNLEVARAHFDLDDLPGELARVLHSLALPPSSGLQART